ncbi:MAG TPA: hypothetical protein VFE51_08445 [Verrucomicrobiae bacterium]|nr:hypothetical protein [Verrucomicrobiae bacterium]
MQPDQAKQILTRQIEATHKLNRCEGSSPDLHKWRRDTEVAIEKIFGTADRHVKDFKQISYSPGVYWRGMPDDAKLTSCQDGLTRARLVLQSMIEEIGEYGTGDSQSSPSSSAIVERLCRRFHYIARSLRQRHNGRPTLDVQDEYDAQDLMHALLHLHFEDIRAEQWTPSYAGGSARMDLLLKQERLVLELKRTRQGLGAKEIGDQLIIDIQRYQIHPDCRTLFCFVYDPDGRIGNPRGLENDLNGEKSGVKVVVIIAP